MEDEPNVEPAAKAPRKNRWDTPASSAAASAAEHLSATAVPSVSNAASLSAGVLAAKEMAKEALAKAQRAADVQKALAQHLPGLAGLGGVPDAGKQPTTVTIDAQGRLLDEHGKVIQSTARPQASIKVNQAARVNPLIEAEEQPLPDPRANKYYDPRMGLPGQHRDQRKKRAFSFVPEGHFSRKGDDLRAKAAVELMIAEANKPSAKRKAAASALAAAARAANEGSAELAGGGGGGPTAASVRTLEIRLAAVPGAEWWDLPLLSATAYDGPPGNAVEVNSVLEGISHLIEHPVELEPPAEPPPPPPMPLPLTKRERKKLRTQRRLAAEKEKQDQIRCGLVAPPPPKVKISNLMSAMKNEAVADPSAVEAKVRAEMAQRVKNHEMRNAARKLTPAEKKAKKRRKLTNGRRAHRAPSPSSALERAAGCVSPAGAPARLRRVRPAPLLCVCDDVTRPTCADPSGGGTPVSLYRIDQMPSQQKLYKIDKNAQQNHLTGILLLMEECNLLLVEGGPKAQKRYRKLLMNRIDWNGARRDSPRPLPRS